MEIHKYFSMQKYNFQKKNPLKKKTKILQDIITLKLNPKTQKKKIDNIAHNLNLGSNQELSYFGCVMDTKKHICI
jgi:hypothetical protein